MAATYCVVYRTGGRELFFWHRTLPYRGRAKAEEARRETERMGYRAYVENWGQSIRLGLPETFEPGDPIPGNEV